MLLDRRPVGCRLGDAEATGAVPAARVGRHVRCAVGGMSARQLAVVVTVPSAQALSDVAVLCPLVTGRSGATRWLSRLTPGGLGTPGELAALWLWTVFVTRVFFVPSRASIPVGVDFVMTTMGNHMWEHARRCGACALWSGDTLGGAPALVDTLGGPLHPLVAVTTLLWGVVNGAKVVIVVAFFVAGVGQWLLARELGFGATARLWSGAMAIVAGNLYGPLSDGLLPVVVAASTATLLLAMVVRMALDRGGRPLTAGVGVLLAMLVMSGQGYLQAGFVLGLPTLAILVAGRGMPWRRFLARFAASAAIGALVAAPLLVPFAHFWPYWGKPGDSTFGSSQPFRFVPLNLVIDDVDFYRNGALGKVPYPAWYLNFVGWIAVAVAVAGVVGLWRRGRRRLVVFLATSVVGAFWMASATPFRWVSDHALGSTTIRDLVAGIRVPSLIAGLAVAPVLALGAAGLDGWSQKLRTAGTRTVRGTNGRRVAVAAVIVVSIAQCQSFADKWMATSELPVQHIDSVLDELATPDLQWVQPPFGEEQFVLAAIGRGIKVAWFDRPWSFVDRPAPTPVLEVTRDDRPGRIAIDHLGDDLSLYAAAPGSEYAAVVAAGGERTVCAARGEGGDIDVACDAPGPGVLVVRENALDGWRARVDGAPATVSADGQWLAVDVPAGPIDVQLRYRPWDAGVGFALMFCGIALAAWLTVPPHWRRRRQPAEPLI